MICHSDVSSRRAIEHYYHEKKTKNKWTTKTVGVALSSSLGSGLEKWGRGGGGGGGCGGGSGCCRCNF